MDSQPSFLDACKEGNVDVVELLIQQGADKEANDEDNRTPLHWACAGGHLKVVELLIERGADKEAKDDYEWTPLHWACEGGHLEVVKLLIQQGADIKAKDDEERTPLHWACVGGHLEMVKLFIQLGADKETKDKLNRTPLHLACEGGHLEVVKLLIQLGAEKEAKDKLNRTSLHLAFAFGHPKVVDYLKKDRNVTDDVWLVTAEMSDFLWDIESKVEQYKKLSSLIPFDPEAQNEKKKTAIQIAMEKGNISFAHILFCIRPQSVSRHLSISNMSFQRIPNIDKFKKFVNQCNLVRELVLQRDYEKRAADLKYENGLRKIFPDRCDSVITQQESELQSTSTVAGQQSLDPDTLALDLYIAICGYDYKKIEELVVDNPDIGLLNVKNIKGNTFIHLVANLIWERIRYFRCWERIRTRCYDNFSDIDGSTPFLKKILQGLKIKYPKEDSGILSLVAVACFLIDNRCDWTATNKKERTAADILSLRKRSSAAEIFEEECNNRHLAYQILNGRGPSLCVVGNTLQGPDSNGRMSSTALINYEKRELASLLDAHNRIMPQPQPLSKGNNESRTAAIENHSSSKQVVTVRTNDDAAGTNSATLSTLSTTSVQQIIAQGARTSTSYGDVSNDPAAQFTLIGDASVDMSTSYTVMSPSSCARQFGSIPKSPGPIFEEDAYNENVSSNNGVIVPQSTEVNMNQRESAGAQSDCLNAVQKQQHNEPLPLNVSVSHEESSLILLRALTDNGIPISNVNALNATAGSCMDPSIQHGGEVALGEVVSDDLTTTQVPISLQGESNENHVITLSYLASSHESLAGSSSGTMIVEDDTLLSLLETNSSAPPPTKRMRMANASTSYPPQRPAETTASDWYFGYATKAPNNKRKVHLKDPNGASYTRNGKETTWRCSSKSKCPAIVRKVRGDSEYKLYNNHSCPTKTHGPADLSPIPPRIQEHLSDSQENLVQLVNNGF